MKYRKFIGAVTDWNYDRNGLEWDFELEKAMFEEEMGEFFDAYSNYKKRGWLDYIVDMADAWADSAFVYLGTRAKGMNSKYYGLSGMYSVEEKHLATMEAILTTTLEKFFGTAVPEGLLERIFEIVLEANKKKGTKLDENGKVLKPADFVKPEKTIKDLLLTTRDRLDVGDTPSPTPDDNNTGTVSDGGSSGYYVLPRGATQLQDLIEYRNMNGNIKDIFKACYRRGVKSDDTEYDTRKMVYYSLRELGRVLGRKDYLTLAAEVIGDQAEEKMERGAAA